MRVRVPSIQLLLLLVVILLLVFVFAFPTTPERGMAQREAARASAAPAGEKLAPAPGHDDDSGQ